MKKYLEEKIKTSTNWPKLSKLLEYKKPISKKGSLPSLDAHLFTKHSFIDTNKLRSVTPLSRNTTPKTNNTQLNKTQAIIVSKGNL